MSLWPGLLLVWRTKCSRYTSLGNLVEIRGFDRPDVCHSGGISPAFLKISMEMIYGSLYFCTNARQRGETGDAVAYLINDAKFFDI